VYPAEKILGQKFLVDVECALDLSKAGSTSQLADTVDYDCLVKDIKSVMCGKSQDLLEAVGQSVASLLIQNYPRIMQVKILIKKPHIAIEGVLDYVGVELTRRRSAASTALAHK
jgi:dihydroneopterin aldolase